MPTRSLPQSVVLSPLGSIGRVVLDGVAYLGRLGTLTIEAIHSLFRPGPDDPPLRPEATRQAATVLAMGLPLVALVHVGMGSFLSMQAYFGGTFVDGTGAVVGVGLIRNIAPLMTGLTLAGLVAALTTPELRAGIPPDFSRELRMRYDRGRRPGLPDAAVRAPSPGRVAAVRFAAALVVGPVLTLWGVAVGTVVGWQVAGKILGVSTNAFFYMFTEMLWLRDVAGLLVKGMLYALFAAMFACHEGLRRPAVSAPGDVPAAACRAACLSASAILVLNSAWFLLVYHAGPAFGPTLMAPPAP